MPEFTCDEIDKIIENIANDTETTFESNDPEVAVPQALEMQYQQVRATLALASAVNAINHRLAGIISSDGGYLDVRTHDNS